MEQKTQFNSYSNIIKNLDFSRIKDSNSIPKELELDRDGQVSIRRPPNFQ